MVRHTRGSFDGTGVQLTWKRDLPSTTQAPYVTLWSSHSPRLLIMRAQKQDEKHWTAWVVPSHFGRGDRLRIRTFLSSLAQALGVQVQVVGRL